MATNFDPDFIERIVQEVLRRLSERGIGGAAPVSEANQLSLDERVVALETLRGRLNGIKTVVVSDRAIVTPAVKDELSDRRIELIRRQ